MRCYFLIFRPCYTTFFFFFNDTATTEIYTLSLHDALPISQNPHSPHPRDLLWHPGIGCTLSLTYAHVRSEEHTSELQSPCNLVCRLLLEKKKTSSWRIYIQQHSCTVSLAHLH